MIHLSVSAALRHVRSLRSTKLFGITSSPRSSCTVSSSCSSSTRSRCDIGGIVGYCQHRTYLQVTTPKISSSSSSSQSTTIAATTAMHENEHTGPLISSAVSVRDAWPHLKYQFEKYLNDEGLFPIISHKDQILTKDKMMIVKKDDDSVKPRAAVLVLLCTVNGQPSILFTRRSSTMNNHAAEISFPGGQYEDGVDTSDTDTALREAFEELVPTESNHNFRHNIKILGQTTDIPSLKLRPVTAIVGVYWNDIIIAETTQTASQTTNAALTKTLQHDDDYDNKNKNMLKEYFIGNPDEVDTVFTIPIQELYRTESKYLIKETNRFGLKHTPMYPSMYGEVWGLTAFILKPILHNVLVPVFSSCWVDLVHDSCNRQSS